MRSDRSRGNPTDYLIAVALATGALLLRLALAPAMGYRAPYMTFLLASAISAALGGFWPGATTTALGVLCGGLFLPPGGWFHLTDPSDPSTVLRYSLAALVVAWLCGNLFSSRDRARAAEARLRESERVYRAIGESIPYGIWICDATGRNTYCSDSFLSLTGLTQSECAGFGWSSALHPGDREETVALWKECVRTGGAWDKEHRFHGKDGQYHPVLARGVPIRDDGGRTVSWAGIHLDIERLKNAEAELERQAFELTRSNEALEQFAFAASHDLQEPLRAVNIYTELLLSRLPAQQTAEMRTFAAYIHNGVEKMERLIRDLLSISRVIHAEVVGKPVAAESALDAALGALATVIEAEGAEISRKPLPVVVAQESHVIQVFQNLVSNAIKYRQVDRTPSISVSAEIVANEAVFLVEDNGMGFDPAFSELIFGLFKRLHGRKYPGTGLGLAICRRVIDRHGGRIWAESTPGEGSRFYFALPLAADTSGPAEAQGDRVN